MDSMAMPKGAGSPICETKQLKDGKAIDRGDEKATDRREGKAEHAARVQEMRQARLQEVRRIFLIYSVLLPHETDFRAD